MSGPNQPRQETSETRKFSFDNVPSDDYGSRFVGMMDAPSQGQRFTARLSREAVAHLVARDVAVAMADHPLNLFTCDEYRASDASGAVRVKFSASVTHHNVCTWFPALPDGDGKYVTVLLPSDGCHAVDGCVLAGPYIRVGAFVMHAPKCYQAFGVVVSADMLQHVGIHSPLMPLLNSEKILNVRGWLQISRVSKAFPELDSARYDAVPGISFSGVVTPPRYVANQLDVSGGSIMAANWEVGETAVVVLENFGAITFGCACILDDHTSSPTSFKFCVKSGIGHSAMFDVFGLNGAVYKGTTFVVEASGRTAGRMKNMGLSLPYEEESRLGDVMYGRDCGCQHLPISTRPKDTGVYPWNMSGSRFDEHGDYHPRAPVALSSSRFDAGGRYHPRHPISSSSEGDDSDTEPTFLY